MIVISIKPTDDSLKVLFDRAKQHADCIEIRLDGFSDIPYEALNKCVQEKNIILSHFPEKLLDRVLSIKPYAIDIPYGYAYKQTDIHVICSYHDYEKTPDDLFSLFRMLLDKKADSIKCVTFANSSLDALSMLEAVSYFSKENKIIGFCMGEKGRFSRQLAPIYGSFLTYLSLPGMPTAAGQLSIDEYYPVDRKTKWFALIGSPVRFSPSREIYNPLFQRLKQNAVYEKIDIMEDEFPEAFDVLRRLGVSGLSVTTPLKKEASANTLQFLDDRVVYMTSDGVGMLDAIEDEVKVLNKTVVVLGAGKTAAAIVQEACRRGAQVFVSNRSEEKAKKLASVYGCTFLPYGKPHTADFFINATTLALEDSATEIFERHLIPKKSIACDVSLHKNSALKTLAEKKGCRVISGFSMWQHQAAYQLSLWFQVKKQNALDWIKD